jgi:hypothetical protein
MATRRPRVFIANPDNLKFLKKETARPVLSDRPGSGLVSMIVITVIALVASAIYVGWQWRNWYLFDHSSVTTRGTVSAAYNAGDKVKIYYSYSTNGSVHKGKQHLTWGEYDHLVVDDRLTVRYITSDPGQSRIEGARVSNTIRLYGVVIDGGLAILLLWLINMVFENRSNVRKLIASGQVVRGEVMTCYYDYEEKLSLTDLVRGISMGAFAAMLTGMVVHVHPGGTQEAVGLKVQYRFTSPHTFKVIRKTVHVRFYSTGQFSVPLPGMPVAILYKSDHLFRML